MSGEGSEAAGAALLAALTGLSPPPNASGKGGSSSDSPGSGQGSDATTTTATSAGNNKKTPPSVTKSFNIGGSAALKAAASKGFKFPTFKFGKKEEKALAAKQSGGEINSPALSTKTTSSKDKDCKENEKCGSCLKVDKNERTFTYHINPDISEPPCKCAKSYPVAKIKTEFKKSEPVKLIAASKDFICYALQNGNIRVIHAKSATTGLLKGDGTKISDLKFFLSEDAGKANILGSLSQGGAFNVRKIFFKQSLEAIESGDQSKNSGEIVDKDPLERFKQFCFFPSSYERAVILTGDKLELAFLGTNSNMTDASLSGKRFLTRHSGNFPKEIAKFACPCILEEQGRIYVYFGSENSDGATFVNRAEVEEDSGPIKLVHFKLDQGCVKIQRAKLKTLTGGSGFVTSINPLELDKAHKGILVGSEGNRVLRLYNYNLNECQRLVFDVDPEFNPTSTIDDTIWNQIAFERMRSVLVCHNIHNPKSLYTIRIGSDEARKEGVFFFDGMKGFDLSTYTNNEIFASIEVLEESRSGKTFTFGTPEKLRMLCVGSASVTMYKFDTVDFYPKGSSVGEEPKKKAEDPLKSKEAMASEIETQLKKMKNMFLDSSPTSSPQASARNMEESPHESKKPKLLTPTQILKRPVDDETTSGERKQSKNQRMGDTKSPVLSPMQMLSQKQERKSKGKRKESESRKEAQLSEGSTEGVDDKLLKKFERMLNDRCGQMELSFQRKLEENKADSLKMMDQLAKSISLQLNGNIPAMLRSHVEVVCKDTLNNAMKTHMEEIIVPSFEKAAKEMFRQMNTTFKSGMKHISSSSAASGSSAKSELQTLAESVKNIEKSLKEIKRKVGKQEPKGPDSNNEILADLKTKSFDDAFTKALMTQNIETVVWLCQQIKEEDFFYTDPFPLSQSVLLALLQQLGSDLHENKDIKLSWIQRISIKLDIGYFKKESLLPHLVPVLEEVQKNLNAAGVASNERSRFEVVSAVLNSVLLMVDSHMKV